ncbi:hypothetical protein ACWGBV_34420, partial [Streptomyces sp. NPDC055051]
MKTNELLLAYQELLDAAELITDTSPLGESDRAQIDWILAHIALSDRALAEAGRDVLAGRAARLDNERAMSKSEIGRILASTTHAERAELVRRNAMELVDLLALTPEA